MLAKFFKNNFLKSLMIALALAIGTGGQPALADIELKTTVEGGEKHSKALGRFVATGGGALAVGRTIMTGNITALGIWFAAVLIYELVSLKIPGWLPL